MFSRWSSCLLDVGMFRWSCLPVETSAQCCTMVGNEINLNVQKSEMISPLGSFCLFCVHCKISFLCRSELSTFNIAGNLKSVSGGECMPLKFVRNSLIRCIRFVATSAHVSPVFPNWKSPSLASASKSMWVTDSAAKTLAGESEEYIACGQQSKQMRESLQFFETQGRRH